MTDAYEGQGSFEWNTEKARSNFGKHRVTFEEATSAFRDPFALEDPEHSETEDRLVLIGLSERQRLLVVVYVEGGDTLRLISARAADPR